MQQKTAPPRGSALPLFYSKPSALSPQRHGGLSLKRLRRFDFARSGNAIPLNAAEIAGAQRDYPIVFTDAHPPMPVAVVGIEEGVNLMVGPDGTWRPGSHVPAYVRRYPFLVAEHPETRALTLCIEEGADCLEEGGEEPLFRQGQPSEIARRGLEFCAEFQREHDATREFGRALARAELLIAREARLRLEPDRTLTVRGFKVVDEGKLNLLPAETFLNWRARGWLTLIYAHLLSLGGWDRLVHISKERHVHAA